MVTKDLFNIAKFNYDEYKISKYQHLFKSRERKLTAIEKKVLFSEYMANKYYCREVHKTLTTMRQVKNNRLFKILNLE